MVKSSIQISPCLTTVHFSPTSWLRSAPSQPTNPLSKSATQPPPSPRPKSPRAPAPSQQKQQTPPRAPQHHRPLPPQLTTITTTTTITITTTPTRPLLLPQQLHHQPVRSKAQAQPLHITTTTTRHPSPPHHRHQHPSRSTVTLQTASVAGVTLPAARVGSAMPSVRRSGISVGEHRLAKSAFIASGWLRRVGGGLAGVGGWGVLIS
jgi:hypothetical protein